MSDDYILKRPYRQLVAEFFNYINISEQDMLLLFGFNRERLESFYNSTELTDLTKYELECFLSLIDSHLNVEYFDNHVSFDEHEYVWCHGLRLRTLILDEQFKRGYKKDVKEFVRVMNLKTNTENN